MLFDFVLVTFVLCMGAAWFSMHERLICQSVSKNTSLQLEEKLEHEGWDSLEADGWAVLGSEWEQYCYGIQRNAVAEDGRPSVAQLLTKPPSTTGTRSTPKLSHHGSGATVERDRAMCFQVVQVWLLLSQCGCARNTAQTVAKHERTAAETLRNRCADPGTDC